MRAPRVAKECTCPRARHQHGTNEMYSRCGCRCAKCTQAAAESVLDYTKRRYLARGALVVPALGARRRIHALCAIGYSQKAQAEYLGVSWKTVSAITGGRQLRVSRALLVRIQGMYDALGMTPAPESHQARYSRTVASKHGWAPPLAWDDDTIDDPTAQPSTPEDGRYDWRTELEFLMSFGASEEQALKQLGRTKRALVKMNERKKEAA